MLIPVDPNDPDPVVIERAGKVLRDGWLVAFPTETVYGLGGNARDPDAVRRIYAAKGRPATNPLIVHVAEIDEAQELVEMWPMSALRLAEAFWPGPLTIVLTRRVDVPRALSAGLGTIAIRIPAHPVALALIRAAEVPIAAPSANRSNELSPVAAKHVVRSIGERVHTILDGGPTNVGIESTVVDLTRKRPRILRPGVIDAARIAAIVGPLDETREVLDEHAPKHSPGQMERHYAPRARLVLASAGDESVRELVRATRARGEAVGLVSLGELDLEADVAVKLPRDPLACAARLYATLHACDDEGCALIVFERPPTDASWVAIRDRLERAATPA